MAAGPAARLGPSTHARLPGLLVGACNFGAGTVLRRRAPCGDETRGEGRGEAAGAPVQVREGGSGAVGGAVRGRDGQGRAGAA